MGKFETETLPKALVEAQAKAQKLQRDLMGLGDKLDYDDEFADHMCDCDHCESNTREGKRLDWIEREEMEKEYDRVQSEIDALNDEIKRMTRYKAFVQKAGIK